MRKILTLVAAACMSGAMAQTLNVKVGNVTYQFPAAEIMEDGRMVFADGTSLTIMGKTFTLSEVTGMYVDNTKVTDDAIAVTYDGASATVTVAGNVAKYVEPAVSGAHVSIAQSADLAQEITYTLSGTSTDGEFYMSGSYKATVELNGLTLTNATPVYSGAAVHIQNGKRIKVKPLTGTTSTLRDAATGSQKGCLYVKGHIEFAQKGTLNVYGNLSHAIKAGEYISMKNSTINVLTAVKDGVNCNEFFLMESGTLNIEGVGDDGLQCELDGTESTGELPDHEDEDSGNIYIESGKITINSAAVASKGMKASGDMRIEGGEITITTTGNGTWDTEDLETKAAACLNCDGNMTINGGTLTLTSNGSGGKGAKCDGTMTINGGDLTVKTTGGLFYSNGTTTNLNYTGDTDRIDDAYYSSPKGLKAGVKDTAQGDIVINGGTIYVSTQGNNGEGIESKHYLTINDGTVTVESYDDCINSASEMYLNGGTITVVSKNNDGIDSNGNLTISGGTIIACGAKTPECGLDAYESCKLWIKGGTVLAIGGSNNAVTSTTGSQALVSVSATVTGGNTVSVKSGSNTLVSFTVPASYTGNSGGGGGPGWAPADDSGTLMAPPGGGGPGGGGPGGGGSVLISSPSLTSGTTYTVTAGSTSSNATASTSTGGGGW